MEVKAIQEILVKLGYYNEDRVHSFVDEEMVEVIEKFQSDNGLTVSGKIDNEMLRYLAKMIYDDETLFKDNVLNDVLGVLDNE